MQYVLLASKNEGKIREYKDMVKRLGSDIKIVSLEDWGICIDDIEETGDTYEDNAIIKVRKVRNLLNDKLPSISNTIIIGDDSGLEIDVLEGKPGIESSRFLGKDTPYNKKNTSIIQCMKNVTNPEERTAKYITAIAILFPDNTIKIIRDHMDVLITDHIYTHENIYGYDPIIFVPEYNKSICLLNEEELDNVYHRTRLVKSMVNIINSYNNPITLTTSKKDHIKEYCDNLISTFKDMASRETILTGSGISQEDILIQIIGTIAVTYSKMCDTE